MEALLANRELCGFCGTELADIERGQNGSYTYERELTFKATLRAIVSRKATIED